MTKAMKHLSITAVTAGMLLALMTGAFAQEPADSHHPKAPAAAGAPAAPAPAQGEGKGGMMGGDHMRLMKEKMRKKRGKMMGCPMMRQPKGDKGPSSQAFNGINAKMHQDMAITFTGNADLDFVKAMIAHHQGAIDMAKVVLAFGKDPDVKKVAEGVIETQGADIAWMKEWLNKQGQ